jgi:dienelactone hydrolase
VIVMPQWNSDAGGHVGLAQLLARFGISALRLSLPYHDVRMPPELQRADYIVSSNVMRTLQACRQAVLDARRAVDWLSAQGFERIGILGTSLGSCLSLLTTAHEPRIRAAALNHVSPWFADVVWHGLSTRHIRASLDGQIDLEQLRRLWMPISPMSYLDAMRRTKSLLVYARYDLTFPVELSELLLQRFADHGIPHETFALPCGHYSTGMTPFKFLDAYILIRFLRRHL